MASLYVAECSGMAGSPAPGTWPNARSSAPVIATPPLVEQKLTISGTTNPSSAFGASTYIIRVHTDAICSIAFGASPTATTSNMRLAADQTEYFGVTPGQKIAVISNS